VSLAAHVRVRRDAFALDVALDVAAGEVVAVLGPNGAGKTTLLRALAGLEPLDAGRVVLDGVVLEDVQAGIAVAPERRPVAVVFQGQLLFPHLTALDNVAFGLRCRGASRSVARTRARAWLERVGLAERAAARPAALSGGEAQRVALARALAIEPRLLLLDEPLTGVDVQARAALRRDLRRHLAAFDGVRVLVTHDPLEALALADRVVVLEAGVVVQTGTPLDVTARPRSRWVADLAGVNMLRGRGDGDGVALDGGGRLTVPDVEPGDVFAVIHPRAVTVHRHRPDGSPRNVWRGRVGEVDREGTRVRLLIEASPPIVAEITPAALAELGLEPGTEVWISVKATEVTTYPA
jgi:molybdate transport system ATP-binding protein